MGDSSAWFCPFLPSPLVRVRRMVEVVPITTADHCLDIGCGDGRVLVTAAQSTGCHCTGIDIDAGLIARAEVLAAEAGGEVEARCAFTAGDALAKRGAVAGGEGGGGGGDGGGGDGDSDGGDGTGLDYALLDDHESPFTVVVLYLVPAAMKLVEPVVRALWDRGGVTVVTCKYHYREWNYTRADLAYDLRIIDPRPGGVT